MSHDKNKHISLLPQDLYATNLEWWWTRVEGLSTTKSYDPSSLGPMLRDKLETFYLHFHKTYKHQTWHDHGGDLGWGAPTNKVIWPFHCVVTSREKSEMLNLHS